MALRNALVKDGGTPLPRKIREDGMSRKPFDRTAPRDVAAVSDTPIVHETLQGPNPWDYFGETYVVGIYPKRYLIDELRENFATHSPRLSLDHVLLEPRAKPKPNGGYDRNYLTLRYMAIIEDAIERDLDTCLIFEDDARWTYAGAELERRVWNVVTALRTRPDWAVFYFGAINVGPVLPVSATVYSATSPQTTHAYALSRTGMRDVLAGYKSYMERVSRMPNMRPIACDYLMSLATSHKYVVMPLLCTQKELPNIIGGLAPIMTARSFLDGSTKLFVWLECIVIAVLCFLPAVGYFVLYKPHRKRHKRIS